MAALSYYSNWPSFNHHNSAVTPPELLPIHDNIPYNGLTLNNLPFHNPINYPTLSSSYNYPLTTQQQPLPSPSSLPEFYSNRPFVPTIYDHGQFFSVNPMEQMQPEYYSYPSYNLYEPYPQVQPELMPPLPEIYEFGNGCNVIGESLQVQTELLPPLPEVYEFGNKGNYGGGKGRLSAQSMAARVRRRKISEKTSELGKLVPGGDRMTTAEMFTAAYKYIQFLQAQVGVLQLMPPSPEPDEELQAFVTSPSVQEKLYAAGKCIVSQTLAKTLAGDQQ